MYKINTHSISEVNAVLTKCIYSLKQGEYVFPGQKVLELE